MEPIELNPQQWLIRHSINHSWQMSLSKELITNGNRLCLKKIRFPHSLCEFICDKFSKEISVGEGGCVSFYVNMISHNLGFVIRHKLCHCTMAIKGLIKISILISSQRQLQAFLSACEQNSPWHRRSTYLISHPYLPTQIINHSTYEHYDSMEIKMMKSLHPQLPHFTSAAATTTATAQCFSHKYAI